VNHAVSGPWQALPCSFCSCTTEVSHPKVLEQRGHGAAYGELLCELCVIASTSTSQLLLLAMQENASLLIDMCELSFCEVLGACVFCPLSNSPLPVIKPPKYSLPLFLSPLSVYCACRYSNPVTSSNMHDGDGA